MVAVGFPAHAGMDPERSSCRLMRFGLPRTRGDGPIAWSRLYLTLKASPHTRGWTSPHRHEDSAISGFPAHAGMDPPQIADRAGRAGLPRTRGDGPVANAVVEVLLSASPHTRGWTPDPQETDRWDTGFPAHAGMDPRLRSGR